MTASHAASLRLLTPLMNRRAFVRALVLATLVTALWSATALAVAGGFASRRVCDQPMPGTGVAACHARVVTDASGAPLATALPAGYGPSDLQSAYGVVGATGGSGKVIAIVDAYDGPTTEADLGVYRSMYGLPPCTTANGCFRKVNQSGQAGPLPKVNAGWAQEIALDVQMASAICPNCKILLVEAKSASITDLGTAVKTAASLGATVISNSYGAGESSLETGWTATYYSLPMPVFASSGDSGYGVSYPAAARTVIAVGGTTLSRSSSSRGWTESAWKGAGSGCSAYEAKPSWQTDTGCSRRSVADVSAVADPNTGVAVYDSTAYMGRKGWMVFGGTSAAAPIVASMYALAGNGTAASLYSAPSGIFDVTLGSNGTCTTTYLCTAGAGYDGPTGVGTLVGLGALS